MTNLLLADEINRTSSKTQSALLEAMEERQVTVDGLTRPLPVPFIVLATQNPVGLRRDPVAARQLPAGPLPDSGCTWAILTSRARSPSCRTATTPTRWTASS